MGMVAFGGVQMHQFYLSQKQIDAKIDSLKQRSSAKSAQSAAQNSQAAAALLDRNESNGDGTINGQVNQAQKDASNGEPVDPSSHGSTSSAANQDERAARAEGAEDIAENISKHSAEMEERLKTLAESIKENAV